MEAEPFIYLIMLQIINNEKSLISLSFQKDSKLGMNS